MRDGGSFSTELVLICFGEERAKEECVAGAAASFQAAASYRVEAQGSRPVGEAVLAETPQEN